MYQNCILYSPYNKLSCSRRALESVVCAALVYRELYLPVCVRSFRGCLQVSSLAFFLDIHKHCVPLVFCYLKVEQDATI